MPRPKNPRLLRFQPNVYYFKPRGIPLRFLEEITLEADELEAIKLHDKDKFDQKQASNQMQVSQPTFARILEKAHQKIAQAIIEGKAIRIQEK